MEGTDSSLVTFRWVKKLHNNPITWHFQGNRDWCGEASREAWQKRKSEKCFIFLIIWILLQFYLVALFQVRAATDSKLIELQKKFSSLKETNDRGEKSREKLSGELKDVKKKVTLMLVLYIWWMLRTHFKTQSVFWDFLWAMQCLKHCLVSVLKFIFRREVLKTIWQRRRRKRPNTSRRLAMFTARFKPGHINYQKYLENQKHLTWDQI